MAKNEVYQSILPPGLSKTYLGIQTGFYAFALVLTAFRLWIRRGRYWWEDVFALLAGLFCVLCIVGMWLMFIPHAPMVDRAFQWLGVVTFANVVWFTRTSILISIMRISTSARFSLLIRVSLALFLVLWAVEFSAKMWLCGSNLTYACQTTQVYADVIISMDVASTFVLVALPLIMLWNVKLARIPKTLILLVFGVGVITAATPLTGITGHIQCAADLTVCNFLVTVTFVYRVIEAHKAREIRSAYMTDKASAANRPHVTSLDFATAIRYTNDLVEGLDMLTTVDLGSVNFDNDSGRENGHGRSTIAWDPAWDNNGTRTGRTRGRSGTGTMPSSEAASRDPLRC
ncbi:hypothetical protein CONPUDRAFT_71472 [Coniophora puteana RWD-64-598 SS2]|uniref:Rhodopsin domain-containing protein n=1 Tax=Coniophora puteana (strain RWD-64-598) TaxID=741705 RepID=A0A5M3MUN7_CONPW|nr:uncharacterized protein CONPUDRAFT_71472 [Coniophora puteana RWD-64-598 SS2]EIW82750.1 hypothetical protein CONPUDRAFT_71472 [Coniophora puteana RWD-64-598 SS2]